MSSKVDRGFPHISIIQKSIRELVPRLLDGESQSPPGQTWNGWQAYDPKNYIVSAQRLARDICEIFQVKVKTITVNFCSLGDGVAGRVELSPTRNFFVDVDEKMKDVPSNLAAILGHEVAHIFLQEKGLHFPQKLSDEILTDCAAVFHGFGPVMMNAYTYTTENAYTYTVTETVTTVTTEEKNLGYLTPDELGYVQAKAGYMVLAETKGIPNSNDLLTYYRAIESQISSQVALEAFRVGKSRAHSEFTTPPLALASPWRRLWYNLTVGSNRPLDRIGLPSAYGVEKYVIFYCPLCSKVMRLPIGGEKIAKCPSCKIKLICKT